MPDVPEPAACEPVIIPSLADGDLTPMLVAAINGIEIMNAYIKGGLPRGDALKVMIELTRSQLCSSCRERLN